MDLSRLLKGLLPSFIPLLVYVLADSVFGEVVGLYVGLGTGLAEFLVILVRDRKADPFVAADTALLGAMGLVSLLSGNDLFFKLKPAVLEVVFGASFGLLLVLPSRYLAAYLGRQLKGLEVPEAALPVLRRNLRLLLALLGLHAALTVYAALALSTAAWGFISGVLLYLLFGVVVLAQFLRARVATRRNRAASGAVRGEALLPIVDEEGRVTGQAPEGRCTAGPGLLHPVLRLILADGRGRVLLRRPAPGGGGAGEAIPWDVAVSRNLRVGEGLEEALAAALRDDFGLGRLALEAAEAVPRPVLRYRREGPGGSELVFLYWLGYPGDLASPGRGEIRWIEAGAFQAEARAGRIAPQFLEEEGLLADQAAAAAASGGPGTRDRP